MLASAAFCLALLQGASAVLQNSTAGERTSEGEKDVYEAQGSYEHPYYYPYPGVYGHYAHHHHVSHVNDEAVKGLLVPLAGIALLGAAAIAASNPLLLQIGVVGGSIGKRRRRRALPRLEDLKVLERYLEQIPKPTVVAQEKKLQANYLQCSDEIDRKNRCFERVTCEVGRAGNSTQFEKQVLGIVISDIMRNEHVSTNMKYRIREAQRLGFQYGDCSMYRCQDIES